MDKKKYAASTEYMNLVDIAKIMTERGYKMNHSTTRKYLLSGLSKIAHTLLVYEGYTEEEADNMAYDIAKSPEFHEYVKDMLTEIYNK